VLREFEIQVRLGRLDLTEFERPVIGGDEIHPCEEQRWTDRREDPFREGDGVRGGLLPSITPPELALDTEFAVRRSFADGMDDAALHRHERELALLDPAPEGLDHDVTGVEQGLEAVLDPTASGSAAADVDQPLGPGGDRRFQHDVAPVAQSAQLREVDPIPASEPGGRDDRGATILEFQQVGLVRVPPQDVRRVLDDRPLRSSHGPGDERVTVLHVVPDGAHDGEVVVGPVHRSVAPQRPVEPDVATGELRVQRRVDRVVAGRGGGAVSRTGGPVHECDPHVPPFGPACAEPAQHLRSGSLRATEPPEGTRSVGAPPPRARWSSPTWSARVLLAEIVLPVSLGIVALGALRTARQRRALRMPLSGTLGTRAASAAIGLATLTVAGVAQLTLTGWRWQLGPAAITGVLLLGLLLLRALGRPALLPTTVATVALAGATLTLLLSWALPVRILPVPDGPHAVGTTTIVVRDVDRAERYGPDPGDPRELVVQLWYPAQVGARGVTAPLVPQAAAFVDLGATELGLPRFALSHVGLIPSNATADAPAIGGPLPVVLLAHGWTGFRTIQTDLAEQLASLGWVVVAADHRFGALVTTFPDGRADLFDPEALPEFGTVPAAEYARRSRALVRTFADDLLFVLDTLTHSPPELLSDVLDLERVAFIGHSTGGGAAIAACAEESRCMAVVGFDPWVEPIAPAVLATGPARPMLSLRTEDWSTRPNEAVLQALHRTQRASGVAEGIVGIDGALHRDFTLLGALSPAAPLLGLSGATPGSSTRAATIAWTTRFLTHHVLGVETDPLLDPPSTTLGRLERTS